NQRHYSIRLLYVGSEPGGEGTRDGALRTLRRRQDLIAGYRRRPSDGKFRFDQTRRDDSDGYPAWNFRGSTPSEDWLRWAGLGAFSTFDRQSKPAVRL